MRKRLIGIWAVDIQRELYTFGKTNKQLFAVS